MIPPRAATDHFGLGADTAVGSFRMARRTFSDLLRRAREEGPQRVTVYSEDAVVVVSAAEFARLIQFADRPSLHELLSQLPLRDVDFDFESERRPVREVELSNAS
jgi:antitoxin Phd